MRKAIQSALVFLASLALGFALYAALVGIIGTDFNAFFLYKQLRGNPSGQVVVVRIDNASLDALTKSDLRVLTFTKKTYMDLIDRLEKAGAKAIGLDIIMANPDPDERKFADEIRKYGNVTIAAKLGISAHESERVLPRDVYGRDTWNMIDVLFDKNIVTKIKPFYILDGKPIEYMAIRLYRLYTGDSGQQGEIRNGQYAINPLRKVPLDADGLIRIPFFRQPEAFPSVSLIDVLNGKTDPNFFKDKIVLVGEYGTLIHDSHFSPVDFGHAMPGVEFHANMLEGLLTGKYLAPLSRNDSIALAVLLALASFLLAVYGRIRLNIPYFLVTPFLLLIAGWYGMAEGGFVIDLFMLAVVSIVSPLVIGVVYRYFVVDSKRRFISNAFSHYISPEVVSQIAEHPEALSLWGRKQELTVLFSDIAGFTTLSETLGTDRLFSLISEYLSEMTDILVANQGTLDKYIGDAVMGFYGAPLPLERPEFLACKTALEQQARLKVLGKKWDAEGIPKVEARIGINRGEVMVGNIGSKERFNYTVMGDNVNLASRLEGVNKEYETFICISEAVYERVKDDFVCRKLDLIRVKGKHEGVMIYELVGKKGDAIENMDAIQNYESALDLYFQAKYKQAMTMFRNHPDDGPSAIMAVRCLSLIAWTTVLESGIFTMTTK